MEIGANDFENDIFKFVCLSCLLTHILQSFNIMQWEKIIINEWLIDM